MDFRTDLAVERREICENRESENVTVENTSEGCVKITRIEIQNEAGAEELGKPKGKYITAEIPEFAHDSELLDERLDVLTALIRELLPTPCGNVLVAGLGNENITPDALGPKTARGIFATRHIHKKLAEELGFPDLREVSAVTFGVLGQYRVSECRHHRGRPRGTQSVPTRQYHSADRHRHYPGFGCGQPPCAYRPRNAGRARHRRRCADGG